MKKLLYISGGMTGIKDNNRPAFAKASKILRKAGYRVISPPDLDKYSKHRTWEGFLRRDLSFLVKCDAIATLNGWKKSRGANLEIYVGKALSMEVHPIKFYLKGKKHGIRNERQRGKKDL
jgi:hypothetical protein